MPKVADALLMFTPEQWGQAERFIRFYEHTYSLESRDKRAVVGVRNHFMKSRRLIDLAIKLRPNLQIDHDQLEAHGFTPAANAEEIATVIEAAILELYATLDCMVKVLRAIYGKTSRGFRDSTSATLQSPGKIEGSFPAELKTAIAEARWIKRLLHLRTELTHLATGVIHMDHQTGVVRYDHYGLKEADNVFSIEDIYAWLEKTSEQVNGLVGVVFQHLNGTLIDRESFEPCGMVQGRFLYRYVSPVGELTFNSGRCGAWVWFEKPDLPTCPFTGFCGAYQRKAPVEPGDPPSHLEPAEVPHEAGDEEKSGAEAQMDSSPPGEVLEGDGSTSVPKPDSAA